MPYFKKEPHKERVTGDTFLHGKMLAKHCLYLDRIAEMQDLEAFSSFGFYDDVGGKTPVWLPAEGGLRTVSGLLRSLEEHPAFWYARNPGQKIKADIASVAMLEVFDIANYIGQDIEPLLDDLGRLEAALSDAVELDVPFCLLIRYGNYASGHEMDVRAGYFA